MTVNILTVIVFAMLTISPNLIGVVVAGSKGKLRTKTLFVVTSSINVAVLFVAAILLAVTV